MDQQYKDTLNKIELLLNVHFPKVLSVIIKDYLKHFECLKKESEYNICGQSLCINGNKLYNLNVDGSVEIYDKNTMILLNKWYMDEPMFTYGITVDDDNVYVTDYTHDVIRKFDKKGNVCQVIGEHLLFRPTTIIKHKNILYVATGTNGYCHIRLINALNGQYVSVINQNYEQIVDFIINNDKLYILAKIKYYKESVTVFNIKNFKKELEFNEYTFNRINYVLVDYTRISIIGDYLLLYNRTTGIIDCFDKNTFKHVSSVSTNKWCTYYGFVDNTLYFEENNKYYVYSLH
jgi:hypothetical protein